MDNNTENITPEETETPKKSNGWMGESDWG